MAHGSDLSPKLRAALMDTFADPLRSGVYLAICERPGSTVAQISRRLEEPAQRVRHEIGHLIDDRLVVLDTGAGGRDARGHHHRAVVRPVIDEDVPWSEERRNQMMVSLLQSITADLGRAVRQGTFGRGSGHAEVRIPGEVDRPGWEEIRSIMVAAMERVEAAMVSAAERLAAARTPGTEVICAFLSFEASPWQAPGEVRGGPRPSQWSDPGSGLSSQAGVGAPPKGEAEPVTPELREAAMEALGDLLRARVFITVAERPGVTIAEIATRLAEPARRVRHQVEHLVAAGLIVVDAVTRRRNARERHYRVLILPNVVHDVEENWTAEQRRKIALSLVRLITADIGAAVRHRTFGRHSGHVAVRIPGEVDERGGDELEQIILATMEEVERTMVRSFARLEAGGESGMEVVSLVLYFTGAFWGDEATRDGPRPTMWLPAPDGKDVAAGKSNS